MTADADLDPQKPDWIRFAIQIAKHAPGMGDPLAMPIDLFMEVLEALCDMLDDKQGDSGRAAVDREMRRLLG